MPLRMECAPAFDYARAAHETTFPVDNSIPAIFAADKPAEQTHRKALFTSQAAALALDLRFVAESTLENVAAPEVCLGELDLSAAGHKGLGACADIALKEGQVVTFVLRIPPEGEPPAGSAPTPQKAHELGVSFERESLVGWRSDTVLSGNRACRARDGSVRLAPARRPVLDEGLYSGRTCRDVCHPD